MTTTMIFPLVIEIVSTQFNTMLVTTLSLPGVFIHDSVLNTTTTTITATAVAIDSTTTSTGTTIYIVGPTACTYTIVVAPPPPFFLQLYCPNGFSHMRNSSCLPRRKPAATESRYLTYGAWWVF